MQSSVDASGRGEAGGLQYTGQQLGSSLGVALIGAIVLAGLTSALRLQRSRPTSGSAPRSPRRSASPSRAGIDFVSADQIAGRRREGRARRGHHRRLVDDYEQGPARRLKVGLLAAALLALLALMSTRNLPHDPPAGRRKEEENPELSPSSA